MHRGAVRTCGRLRATPPLHRLRRGGARARREHESGPILWLVERAEQGQPERVRADPVGGADHHALAVGGVGGPGLAERLDAGVGGRDVDVERQVVLGDSLPHLEDQRLLGGREAGNTVDVERCRGDRGWCADRCPGGIAGDVAVEVEIDHPRRRGLRCEREHVRPDGHRQERRCEDAVGERQRFGIAEPAIVGEEQRRVVDEFVDQLVRGDARLGSHVVEVAARDQFGDRFVALEDVEIGADQWIDVVGNGLGRDLGRGRPLCRLLIGGERRRSDDREECDGKGDRGRSTMRRPSVHRAIVLSVHSHHHKVPVGHRRSASGPDATVPGSTIDPGTVRTVGTERITTVSHPGSDHGCDTGHRRGPAAAMTFSGGWRKFARRSSLSA